MEVAVDLREAGGEGGQGHHGLADQLAGCGLERIYIYIYIYIYLYLYLYIYIERER